MISVLNIFICSIFIYFINAARFDPPTNDRQKRVSFLLSSLYFPKLTSQAFVVPTLPILSDVIMNEPLRGMRLPIPSEVIKSTRQQAPNEAQQTPTRSANTQDQQIPQQE